MSPLGWLEHGVLAGTLLLALAFKPWLPLRHAPLQSPWLAALILLPFAWWTQHLMPSGFSLHLSGACLLVLMFGWPLAMWTLPLVSLLSEGLSQGTLPQWGPWVAHVVWLGVLPGTFALALGLAIRRWLPHHLFVYILGRGFFTTALSVTFMGVLAWLAGRKPLSLGDDEWLLAHWLLGWGEAISTGMLTAIFVAFKPQWLLTYSDARYLPPPDRAT
ncbi:hypothetical protein GTZ97_04840 [Aquabacterium fontiphilum]|jgi:uncharacterized membrane protein|uniref:energy-coupling factor ABC transporter permease n=1 Tax=Aquabacterium fontiphilum TaxID=450365 RepID=UPI001377A790|nr:energy-coupling factor ABC transporter permease [Aquabacterium fontiphilum]NBD19995.1 hypothetical protein [Aquabacterium fontiphilum]